VREINVGIRFEPNEGLLFSGIEEVNGLINRGGKVTAVEPGGVLMRKLSEDSDSVSVTLFGCEVKVIVDDSGVEASPKTLEHNRLYKEGTDLVSPYMRLVNRDFQSADSADAQKALERGIELLRQAIAINPANWSAYWVIGKAYQALGKSGEACDAFGKAYGLEKGNADVAREYMFECLNLGHAAQAIAAARHAVKLKPKDAGLAANLALALLIGGKLDDAAKAVTSALALAPDDAITRNLQKIIADVQAGRRRQPSKMADLNVR